MTAAKAQIFSCTVGNPPPHIESFQAEVGANIVECSEALDRAPLHVVDHDAFCIDKDKLKQAGTRRGQSQTDERNRRIDEMRREFPQLWGIRGKAQKVATDWLTLTGEHISLRTIQNYFKLTRA